MKQDYPASRGIRQCEATGIIGGPRSCRKHARFVISAPGIYQWGFRGPSEHRVCPEHADLETPADEITRIQAEDELSRTTARISKAEEDINRLRLLRDAIQAELKGMS